jgi:hypothetical protein
MILDRLICADLRLDFEPGKADVRGVASNKLQKEVARPERLELPTLWFEARCSIQLSYGRFVHAPDVSPGCVML